MGEINRANISLIKSYRNDFKGEYDNFNNVTYNTFSSSYLKRCTDSCVSELTRELQTHYDKVKNGYTNIDKWWNDYNKNFENLESYLSGNGSLGSISEVSVRNYVSSNFCELQNYTIPFADIFDSSALVVENSNINVAFSSSGTSNSFGVGAATGETVGFWDSVSDWWVDVSNWWNDDAVPTIKKAYEVYHDTVNSVRATIATGVVSLVEGLLQFGEAIVDFLTILKTASRSVFTLAVDGVQAIYGALTGNEWDSVTKSMWEDTRGFVSEQHVSGWFDSFYQKTSVGQNLSENAYGFETVRSVGSGIGYTAGVVILTIFTFGAGGAIAGGGAVSATAMASATTASNMAMVAGAAGIGKGTQNAWAEGAGIGEGLGTGVATGLWEGIQYYLGGKIGKLDFFGAEKLIKLPGTKEGTLKLLNSLGRVILDGVDGALEGIIQPLINSIHKDIYFDESTNEYVKFDASASLGERYKELWNDNGGWLSVLTEFFVGSGSSLLGEAFDLRKYFKDQNVVDNKIQYSDSLPNDTKLELMIRDNTVYDRELLMKEFKNKIENGNVAADPCFIFDDLFLLYNSEVTSQVLTFDEIMARYYSDDYCKTRYTANVVKIIENDIQLSDEQLKKLSKSIGNYFNLEIPAIKNYLNKHNIYSDAFLSFNFPNGKLKAATLPDNPRLKTKDVEIKELLSIIDDTDKFLEFYDKNDYDYYVLSAFHTLYDTLFIKNEIDIGLSDVALTRLSYLSDTYVKNVDNMYQVRNQQFEIFQGRERETTMIDGIQYSIFKDIDTKLQSLDVEQVSKAIQEMPDILKSYIKKVEISDMDSYNDGFWALAFNNKGHKAAASAGHGEITFHRLALEGKSLMNTLCHETAHCLDEFDKFSLSTEWIDAVKLDGNFYTKYSESTFCEDFAESVAAFFLENDLFSKKCPNRAKFLSDLFKKLEGG